VQDEVTYLKSALFSKSTFCFKINVKRNIASRLLELKASSQSPPNYNDTNVCKFSTKNTEMKWKMKSMLQYIQKSSATAKLKLQYERFIPS